MSITKNDSKEASCEKLVQDRKTCHACGEGLTNPSVCDGGRWDCNAIGAWSQWQGNLDAELMVVGQDWGDTRWFIRAKGRATDTSKTNNTLLRLLSSIGFDVRVQSQTPDRGALFFTNAILCLKSGGAQASVMPEWFQECGARFLRPTIEIVRPKVVVCLGERAYHAVLGAWPEQGTRPGKFKDAVTSKPPVQLPGGTMVFPVYHCGARTLNMSRNLDEQRRDWKRIGDFLRRPTKGAVTCRELG